MGSSLYRKYSPLGVAHPIWENISSAGCTSVDGAHSRLHCEEGQHVALINLFVKLWNNLVSVYNNCKRVMIELLQIVLNLISHILNSNMDKWVPVNGP